MASCLTPQCKAVGVEARQSQLEPPDSLLLPTLSNISYSTGRCWYLHINNYPNEGSALIIKLADRHLAFDHLPDRFSSSHRDHEGHRGAAERANAFDLQGKSNGGSTSGPEMTSWYRRRNRDVHGSPPFDQRRVARSVGRPYKHRHCPLHKIHRFTLFLNQRSTFYFDQSQSISKTFTSIQGRHNTGWVIPLSWLALANFTSPGRRLDEH